MATGIWPCLWLWAQAHQAVNALMSPHYVLDAQEADESNASAAVFQSSGRRELMDGLGHARIEPRWSSLCQSFQAYLGKQCVLVTPLCYQPAVLYNI